MHPMVFLKKMVDQRLNRQQKTFEDTLGKLCIKLDKIKWIELLMQFYSKHFFLLFSRIYILVNAYGSVTTRYETFAIILFNFYITSF